MGPGEVVGAGVGSGPIKIILASPALVTFNPSSCISSATASRFEFMNDWKSIVYPVTLT